MCTGRFDFKACYTTKPGVPNILDALLKTCCKTLNDESLRTLTAEGEPIVNSKTLIAGDPH